MGKHTTGRRYITLSYSVCASAIALLYAVSSLLTGVSQVHSQDITPTPTVEPVSITVDDMTLDVEHFEIWDAAGDKEPENDVFVILFGILHNGKRDNECTRARSVRLYIDGDQYRPQNDVMDAVKELTQPQRDFMGAYAGHCIDANESAPTFVAFDTPDDFSEVELEFKGERIPLTFEIGDTTTTMTGTPVPVFLSEPDDAAFAQSIVANSFTYMDVNSVEIRDQAPVPSIRITFEYNSWDDLDLTNSFIVDAICGLLDAGFTSHNFRFTGTVELVDSFGNIRKDDGIIVIVWPETAAKFNCENTFMVNLDRVADSYYAHPALR